jgi:UrcA family protein
MKTVITLIAAATFATASFSIAHADTSIEPRSVTVRFADLDTTNVQGAAVLFRRIRSAAESVCKDLRPDRQLGLMQQYDNCLRVALGNAVAEIDRPMLTAYAAARGVHSADTTIKIASTK